MCTVGSAARRPGEGDARNHIPRHPIGGIICMRHLLTALLATSAIAGAAHAQDAKKVFFLLPNTTTIRFESRDAPFFVEAMKEKAPGAEVIVQNAQGDPQQQQRQIEDAIAQGANLILLTSADANLVAGGLAAAEAAGVPVVLYDHDAV